VHRSRTLAPLITAGVLLGIGLGGFVDGIVLHQLLQWHHMLSSAGFPPSSVQNLEINTLGDGLFHALTWILTAGGLAVLWHAARRRDVPWSARAFVGSLSLGWGAFNLAEGLIDHQLLGIHHVNETAPPSQWLYWDLGFLAFGAILAGVGWALLQAGRHESVVAEAPDHSSRLAA
jgi:uncharacterized membrane protein